MRIPRFVARFLILLCIFSALYGCGKKASAPTAGKGPDAAMPPAEVSVVTVAPKAVALVAELPGRLQATRTAQVRARVEGIVQQRLFREGSDVAAGAVLMRIDPAMLQAEVDAAQAALAKAEADAAQARNKADRYQTLINQNAISKQEYDEVTARAKQTAADVSAAKAALTRAKLNLNYATVTAPISGRIGRAQVTEGALVGKNEATLLATIEQIDPIYVNFTQSNAEFSRIRRAIGSGQFKNAADAQMTLLLDDGTTYAEQGKLLFSDSTVDPTTGEVALRAQFSNANRTLLPGMYVRVRFEQAVKDNALTVPQQALIRNGKNSSVMLVGADGKVAVQPVKVDQAQGDQWIVTEGLKGGEQVIVEGLQKIKPGMPVKATPFTAPQS